MAIMSPRAWLLIASGSDRQYGGNDGYSDEPDVHYVWDSTVPHHNDLRVGDRVALWNKKELLGYSVIEEISTEPESKLLKKCPETSCGKSSIKARKTKSPKYRCQVCGAEFDHPSTETKEVTRFESRHDAAWVDAQGALSGAELRRLCESPGSQQSMRPLDWNRFRAALGSTPDSEVAAVDDWADASHGGHTTKKTRVRLGQGKFRKATLSRYGPTCAFTGAAPEAVLDAAHLYSYAKVGEHLDHGGLMVRADIHKLFDRGAIAVDPTTLVVDVREDIREYAQYADLHGRPLHVQIAGSQRAWVRDHWIQYRTSPSQARVRTLREAGQDEETPPPDRG